MKNVFLFLTVALVACFAACQGKGATAQSADASHESYTINRFEKNPYLAEIWWGDDYDEAVAMEKMAAQMQQALEKQGTAGACSSWHKGQFHGRNIDWTMRDFATLIIHMPRNEAKGVKYASVSLMAGNPKFTRDFIENNEQVPDEYKAWLPAAVVDGINECGLTINHNIVPYDDRDYAKSGELSTLMVCRYVLDHFATAKEAVDYLRSVAVAQAVIPVAHDYSHFMLSDATSSYVVEWVGKEFVATEFKADDKGNYLSASGMPAIMTNYFVALAERHGLGTQDFFVNHSTGAGVERALLVKKGMETAETLEDHLNICRSVMYRQFCQGKTDWATENAGYYGYSAEKGKAYWSNPNDVSEVHWMDDADVYGAAKAMMASQVMTDYYADFNQKWDKCDPQNSYWYTQHSVVYDTKEKKGYVIMQEGMFDPSVVEIGVE